MLAAESNLSIGAHISAEKEMSCIERLSDKMVTILDGGPALLSEQRARLPKAGVMRCQKHLLDELMKSKGGREAKDKYMQLSRLPKNHNAVAEKLYSELPACSAFRNVPKDQLFQVFLPPGQCTHGNLTNNMAEVFNWMAMPVRKEVSLYRSMVRVEEMLRRRQQTGMESIAKAKVDQNCTDVEKWKSMGYPPSIDVVQKKLGIASTHLLPVEESKEEPDTFLVQSDASIQCRLLGLQQ